MKISKYFFALAMGGMIVACAPKAEGEPAAEPAEEIDLPRAEASGQRARERLAQKAAGLDAARAEASLRRALARQKAAHLASEQ